MTIFIAFETKQSKRTSDNIRIFTNTSKHQKCIIWNTCKFHQWEKISHHYAPLQSYKNKFIPTMLWELYQRPIVWAAQIHKKQLKKTNLQIRLAYFDKTIRFVYTKKAPWYKNYVFLLDSCDLKYLTR